MNYKKFSTVDLAEVKFMLRSELFLTDMPGFVFLPSVLLEWANQSKIKIGIDEISNWEEFEYGRADFNNADFYRLWAGDKIYSVDDEIVFVSDESIMTKSAFLLKVAEFDDFTSFYEEMFAMAFFQPSDYIIYNKNQRILKAIHHEGKLISIKR